MRLPPPARTSAAATAPWQLFRACRLAPMKKLAIGCGVVLVLIAITVAGIGYYAYRKVSSTVAQFAELGQVPEIERDIRNRNAYSPPASGELTDDQIEKLLRVQNHVRERIGARLTEFEAKYRTLADKKDATISDTPTIIAAYRDLAATWLDAKRGQVEALNNAGLSLEEYRWIRDQSYSALGIPFVDFDLARLVDEAKRGLEPETPGRVSGAIAPTGPERNRTRVERVRKQLEQSVALASFGL